MPRRTKPPKKPSRCAGPDCDRDRHALVYCEAHYRQHLRGGPVKPLQSGDTMALPGLWVSPTCWMALIDAARRQDTTIYKVARAWLEERAREGVKG